MSGDMKENDNDSGEIDNIPQDPGFNLSYRSNSIAILNQLTNLCLY